MWIPQIVIKWLGGKIADKIGLEEESKMDGTKSWWKSKTVWTGIIAGLLGIYGSLAPGLHWPGVPEWVFAVLGGMGIYTRVSATDKIG